VKTDLLTIRHRDSTEMKAKAGFCFLFLMTVRNGLIAHNLYFEMFQCIEQLRSTCRMRSWLFGLTNTPFNIYFQCSIGGGRIMPYLIKLWRYKASKLELYFWLSSYSTICDYHISVRISMFCIPRPLLERAQ